MNERINDLMNQAMPIIDWKARHGVELDNGERNKWYAEWFENFADLVIDMCADHIMMSSDRYRKEYFAAKVLELKNGIR